MQTSNEDINDYLGGYARTNPVDMEQLSQRVDWKDLAQWEQQRRAAKVLEVVDDATLAAIAAGALDFRLLCQQALDANRGKR